MYTHHNMLTTDMVVVAVAEFGNLGVFCFFSPNVVSRLSFERCRSAPLRALSVGSSFEHCRSAPLWALLVSSSFEHCRPTLFRAFLDDLTVKNKKRDVWTSIIWVPYWQYSSWRRQLGEVFILWDFLCGRCQGTTPEWRGTHVKGWSWCYSARGMMRLRA